jgi:hypothetical protein
MTPANIFFQGGKQGADQPPQGETAVTITANPEHPDLTHTHGMADKAVEGRQLSSSRTSTAPGAVNPSEGSILLSELQVEKLRFRQ